MAWSVSRLRRSEHRGYFGMSPSGMIPSSWGLLLAYLSFGSAFMRASPPRQPRRMETSAVVEADYGLVDKAVNEAALVLKMECGVLGLMGEDRLRFLHNQMTNSFMDAAPGHVIHATYCTALGRTIDLVTALVLEEEVLLLCSPERREAILQNFDKYIFPLDRVRVADKTGTHEVVNVVGPLAGRVLERWGGQPQLPTAAGRWEPVGRARCWRDTGLALPGYMVVGAEGEGGVLRALEEAAEGEGALIGGQEEWQMLRIAQGRPCPGKELTEEVTPLEAGLWHTVHFDKGCYLGQETIAKVARNRGERQRLWGFVVRAGDPAAVSEGARLVTVGGKGAGGGRAGVVTSVLEQQGRGLAYVRKGAAAVTEAGKPGMILGVEGTDVQLETVELPFATRTEAQAASPPAAAAKEGGVDEAEARAIADAKAAEAERKAKKLEEMRQRLEAFQKQQKGGA